MSDIKWTKKAAIEGEEIDCYELLRKAQVDDIDTLAEALGYQDADDFFRDNPGAFTAVKDFVIEWMESGRGNEYVKSIKKYIAETIGQGSEDLEESQEGA